MAGKEEVRGKKEEKGTEKCCGGRGIGFFLLPSYLV
jgi:hypothetical protein